LVTARLMNWVLVGVTLLLLGQDYWQQLYHPITLLDINYFMVLQ